MKTTLFTLAFILASSSAFSAPATKTVIAKEVTSVGFAPPAYRGMFVTQILSDGTVEKIDNKGQKKVVLKLSKSALKSLTDKIAALENGELTGDDGRPGCMDAPTIKSVVIKGEEEIIIKRTAACKTTQLYTEGANELNQVVSGVADIANSLLR